VLLGVAAVWRGLEGIYAVVEQNQNEKYVRFSLVLLFCGGFLLKFFWRAIQSEL
jgi:hypothetical protein